MCTLVPFFFFISVRNLTLSHSMTHTFHLLSYTQERRRGALVPHFEWPTKEFSVTFWFKAFDKSAGTSQTGTCNSPSSWASFCLILLLSFNYKTNTAISYAVPDDSDHFATYITSNSLQYCRFLCIDIYANVQVFIADYIFFCVQQLLERLLTWSKNCLWARDSFTVLVGAKAMARLCVWWMMRWLKRKPSPPRSHS